MARELKGLPLHHIDTSIILEPRKTADGLGCTKYLQRVGYKYHGILSLPVLSELFLAILLLDNSSEKYNLMDTVLETIRIRKINLYSPKSIEETAIKVRQLDSRVGTLDSHIVACAIEDKANLITLDKKLTGNIALEKEFGVKIFHPKSLP